jgi:hypothetical protein
MRSIIILLAVLFVPFALMAQLNQEWVVTYNGPYGPVVSTQGTAMAKDASGNIYIAGSGFGGYMIVKYNASGDTIWHASYSDDSALATSPKIAVDNAGNTYITGTSGSLNAFDFVTLKFNASGVQQWCVRYNGQSNSSDWARDIAVDDSGNVYVTGLSDDDYTTVKYNANGIEQWIAHYNGPGNNNDNPKAIAVDSFGNVYVTGSSSGGYPTYTDIATVKYNSSGIEKWVARYNGLNNSNDGGGYSIAVDGSGNVYVTGSSIGIGTSHDYTTLKYDSSGIEQWVDIYSGTGNSDDIATALALDEAGNVYITGYSYGGSSNYYDCVTIKYNATGSRQWVAIYNRSSYYNDWGNAIAIDDNENVYVTGYSGHIYGDKDYLTLKYNSSGVQQWVKLYDGPLGDEDNQAYGIALDISEGVYITGVCYAYGGKKTMVTIKYSCSSGNQLWTENLVTWGPSKDYGRRVAIWSDYVYVTGTSSDEQGNKDIVTIKYNSSGVQQWETRYGGTGTQESYALAVDLSGNIYVVGEDQSNYVTIKYDPQGVQQWVKLYDGPNHRVDVAQAVVCNENDVWVTGYSGVSSSNLYDIATIRYSANSGTQRWVARGHFPYEETAVDIALGQNLVVCVTGRTYFSAVSYNYQTAMYDSNGTCLWVKQYDGTGHGWDEAQAVALDFSNNVYVTGRSTGSSTGSDAVTIKYSADGSELWIDRYNQYSNYADAATALILVGNALYVTGYSWGNGNAKADYLTIRYNTSTGDQEAIAFYDGSVNESDYANDIAFGNGPTIYVTGYSIGTSSGYDYATVMYDVNLNELGSSRFNGSANLDDYAVSVAADNFNHSYVTGYCINVGQNNDIVTIKYSGLTPPETPVLVSPANSATDQPIVGTLTWNTAARATGYDVYLDVNNPPTTKISSDQTDLTYNYSSLDNNQTYYWKVVAKNGAGSTSSAIWNFTTIIAAPGAFNLTCPTSGLTNVPIEGDLTWDASERATSYEVTLGDNTYTVTTNSYHYSGLSYITEYTWNVQAINAGGNTNASNGPFTFTTIIQLPELPELVSPENSATIQPLSGILTWNPALRADNYDVYFGTDNPPLTKVSENQTSTTYNYSVSTNEQTYFWQIVAKNAGGSTPSLVWYFTTGRLDAGVTEITEPSGIIDTLPETPEAVVKNFGTLPADFSVTYLICDSATLSNIYTGTVSVTNLLPGDPFTVEFPVWNKPTVEGRYYSQCYTVLTNDANPSNDLASSQFAVEGKSQTPSNWTQRPSVPIGSQNRTVKLGACLAVDEEGYNVYLLKGDNTGEFYQFNPGTGNWTTLDALPSDVKEGGTLTQVNGKFYATTGGNTVEFWEYDPNGSPKWTQKANVPADVHSGASSAGVMINGTGYVYLLRASVSFDFLRYNVSTNTWETMASAPYVAGEEFKKGSSISYDGTDTIYVLKGNYNTFYAYVVSTNTWLTKPSLPLGTKNKAAKGGADILYHQRKVYCIKGSNSQEFWVYQCNTGEWSQWSDVPLGSEQKRVDDGGSMIYSYHYRYLYITKGHSLEFLSYGQLSNFAHINQTPKLNDNTQNNENGIVINYELKANPSICHEFAQISYAIPKAGNVMLKLYDATGREVRILAQGKHEPGRYNINFNAYTLAQGIYYLKYESGNYREIKKLIVQL